MKSITGLPARVVTIGAGSAIFGLGTLATLMRSPRLRGGTLALVDVNAEGLSLIDALACRLDQEWGAGLTIISSLHRDEVLAGADFVIVSIEVVLQADKRVVTDRHATKTPTWLMGLICTRGLLSEDDLVEIGEIINGKQPGRENDKERISFNPTGLGVEDVIAAQRVYQQAVARGIGQELELWHDPIWV